MAIYSTFLQRAYDQLIHDVALQNLPVVFAVDRGGLVGADGPTHHGTFDLSFAACIPNMLIMAPANEVECRQLLSTAYSHDGPSLVRYPRGSGEGTQPTAALDTLPIGKGELLRHGEKVAGHRGSVPKIGRCPGGCPGFFRPARDCRGCR